MESIILIGSLNITAVLVAVVIGAICGYLAGQIMKGSGMGLLGNIVVGIVGAALFSFLFGSLHLVDMPWVNEIASGTLGSMLLLFLISLFRKTTAAA